MKNFYRRKENMNPKPLPWLHPCFKIYNTKEILSLGLEINKIKIFSQSLKIEIESMTAWSALFLCLCQFAGANSFNLRSKNSRTNNFFL